MTDEPSLRVTDDIEPETVEPLLREGLLIVGLAGVILLGGLLPGTARALPGTEVTIGGLVTALGTLGIVASLVVGAPQLRETIDALLIGPSTVVSAAAAIGQYLAIFIAVVFAYHGFAPVLRPVLTVQWVYDLAFLLLALGPLALVARHFYRAIDPLVAFLVTLLVDDRAAAAATSSGPAEK